MDATRQSQKDKPFSQNSDNILAIVLKKYPLKKKSDFGLAFVQLYFCPANQ